jgi:hypothetical protein
VILNLRSGAELMSAIVTAVFAFIVNFLTQFWMWFAGAAVAILAFLFSPTLRKYTIGIIAALILLGLAAIWGYNLNHPVEVVTHTCEEFRKWLVKGPATDKAIDIFQRHGLCV